MTKFSTFSRLIKDRRGSTAVEMAFVALPFFALLIGCLQVGIIYLSQSALEVATEKSARLVLTGTVQGANGGSAQTQSQFLTTVCGKLPSLLNCANLMVDAKVYSDFSSADTSAPTVTYNPDGTVKNNWSYNVGGAGDIVVLRVLYLLPVVGGPLGSGFANSGSKRVLMSTAVFKNEPYQ